MAFDIQTFHRTCPVLPDHKPFLVVGFRGKFLIDHDHPFGAMPASSNAGHIANAAVDIWECETGDDNHLFKYEDDLNMFRYPNPTGRFIEGSYSYTHDRNSVMDLIADLQIPWHPKKTGTHFLFIFTFIGFQWNLPLRQVSLPEEKRRKYLARVTSMLDAHDARKNFCLRDIQVLHGTLVHVSFVFPEGASRLPVFSNFTAG